ncbi:cobalamin biosynthesis protein CobW [Saccharobesus litoralis]|uniref:Cobalamin biosynthesis protein CobW n=1 Tax=Saccharobesus litoralis TaxID=2172099 RepID=A0A2S0VLT2_9ALTE|nr:GTP-binding protein [Saccharobesus litoralis]AWB65161.1 cobalamin biosynthesis protein CobW [Saccharobesus litoralis]
MSSVNKVPTHIISGFLGSGKTTVISHLLKHKPQHENWAVLVNEFGKVGIDGSLIKSTSSQDNQIFVKEVPGGCMCCAAGVPVNVALVEILRKIKPDRLLIEPSGLGHLDEIVDILQSETFRHHIGLGYTITLVDARNIADSRYTSHSNFKQQLALADIIVASHADLYDNKQIEKLNRWLALQHEINPKLVTSISNGKLPVSLLTKQSFDENDGNIDLAHTSELEWQNLVNANQAELEQSIADNEVISYHNKGDGYFSYGWHLGQQYLFSLNKLQVFVQEFSQYRVKALVLTDKGIVSVNQTKIDVLPEQENVNESCFEMICWQEVAELEKYVKDCLC